MRIAELVKSVEYVVDAEGHKKGVLLDFALWEALLAFLENSGDTEVVRQTLATYDIKGMLDREQVKSEAPEADLSTKNQRLLKLLTAAPHDDKDAEWWADFERELAENRLTFRVIE